MSEPRYRAAIAEAARQLGRAHTPRQLQQHQRIAPALGDDPLPHPIVEPARHHRRQQRVRIIVIEPIEPQPRKARYVMVVARLTDREEHRHSLGKQPARDEPEDLPRAVVEPLKVVDETQQRLLLGELSEQRECRQTDQKAVGWITGRVAQRDP